MTQQITGKIRVIFDTFQKNERYKQREFVLDYVENPDAKYNKPQPIRFTIVDGPKMDVNSEDKVNMLNLYKTGDEVCVWFNINGRQVMADRGVKYFNNLECWRIKSISK